MPSSSKKQRNYMRVLHGKGEITDEEMQHFEKIVPKKKKSAGKKHSTGKRR